MNRQLFPDPQFHPYIIATAAAVMGQSDLRVVLHPPTQDEPEEWWSLRDSKGYDALLFEIDVDLTDFTVLIVAQTIAFDTGSYWEPPDAELVEVSSTKGGTWTEAFADAMRAWIVNTISDAGAYQEDDVPDEHLIPDMEGETEE